MADNSSPDRITRARSLRRSQTKSEGLLWSILRARQLCNLKFRRQHPIGPWCVDFACPKEMIVVEIDGGYHDATIEEDLQRQRDLEARGWSVVRFTDKDAEQDADVIGRVIANALGLKYEFKKRQATGSGMKRRKTKKRES